METDFLKKSGASFLRIIAALAIVLGIITLIYLLWQPGSDKPLPEYSNNAVWLGHGHLGDDSWFIRNRRNKNDFRDKKKISFLFEKLSQHKISTVYPHLCPAQSDGRIGVPLKCKCGATR